MPQVKIDIYDEQDAYMGSLDVHHHADFPLAITQSIADMRDITKRGGASSKSFKVLATANNNRTMKYIYNNNVDANAVVYGKTARVTVDGLPALRANLKVKQLFQHTQPTEYEMELQGDNLEWVDLLKAVNIGDLNYGHLAVNGFTGSFQGTVNFAAESAVVTYDIYNVEASWYLNYGSGFDYVYSLKDYGQLPSTACVQLTDMRPDVYINAIVNKAFNKIGYEFKSDFFSTDFGNRLVLPFFGNNFGKTTAFQNVNFHVSRHSTFSDNNIDQNNQKIGVLVFDTIDTIRSGISYNPSTGIATATQSAKGTINLEVKATATDKNAFLKLYQNNQVIAATTVQVGQSVQYFRVQNLPIDLHVGDTLEVRYILIPAEQTVQRLITPHIQIQPTAFMSFSPLEGILEGSKYEISKSLPAMSCLDVLAGMTNMFNLYFRTDAENKVVYCEPRTNFYKPATQALDWSGKLDVGMDIATEFIDTYSRTMSFKFLNDDKDSLVKSWDDTNKAVAGSLQYGLPVRFPEGSQDLGTKVYAFTILHNPGSSILNYNAGIPTFWSGDGQPPAPTYDFKPRILYYQGLVDRTGTGDHWTWHSAGNTLQYFPVATLGDTNVQLNYNGSNGLVANYYQDDIANIIEGKIVIAYFSLQPADFMMLDISRPIFINHHSLNGYYYINQIIDYQPNKRKSTKVELIKATPSTTDIPAINYNNTINYGQARLGVGLGLGTGNINSNTIPATNYTPAVVLQNNSSNWAAHNSGSVAIGTGLIAPSTNQHILGIYNVASTNDVFQVGVGTSSTNRYRGLTFTADGNFLVQGGYMYTSDGHEVLFVSQRNNAGLPTRFDNLHIQGNH